jgi:hypothetical protein
VEVFLDRVEALDFVYEEYDSGLVILESDGPVIWTSNAECL